MKHFASFHSWLVMLTVNVLAQSAHADVEEPRKSSEKVVAVEISYTADSGCVFPIQELSNSLKSHPRARQFRITWRSLGVSYEFKHTAFYSRGQRRVHLLCWGSGGQDVNYEEYQYRFLVSGVTDSMIHKLAKAKISYVKGMGPYDSPDAKAGGFLDIKKYGARVRTVQKQLRKG